MATPQSAGSLAQRSLRLIGSFKQVDSNKKGGSTAAVAVPQSEKFQNKATNPESPLSPN